MNRFLCYDLKGIQQFIFAVPRLRYVVGASAIVDGFDRRIAPELGGVDHVYSAGGKGAFVCGTEERAAELRRQLVAAAHERGMDIAFGLDSDFSLAANEGASLHPFLPDSLDGEPCRESGLLPVPPGKGAGYRKEGKGVHPVIWRRVWQDAGLRTRDLLEERLLKGGDGRAVRIPESLAAFEPSFFASVDSRDDADLGLEGEGGAGARAIGARNRWAVIAMDGNDIGAQHRTFFASGRSDEETKRWLKEMSRALDACTHAACVAGIDAVLEEWARDRSAEELEDLRVGERGIVLPLRPLILGGDDIVIIVHPAHAMTFVRGACRAFADKANATPHASELWPATRGQLTISAGVVYAPVSLPIVTSIEYADSLLASAKHEGRRNPVQGAPSAACVDWESVTEGLLDTPAARRQREMRFLDEDLDEIVELTRRPYPLAELEALELAVERYGDLPRSLCHALLPSLRTGHSDRAAFCARLGKRHCALATDLEEPRNIADLPKESRWRREKAASDGRRVRSTDIVDAMLLLQERRRTDWETANA